MSSKPLTSIPLSLPLLVNSAQTPSYQLLVEDDHHLVRFDHLRLIQFGSGVFVRRRVRSAIDTLGFFVVRPWYVHASHHGALCLSAFAAISVAQRWDDLVLVWRSRFGIVWRDVSDACSSSASIGSVRSILRSGIRRSRLIS